MKLFTLSPTLISNIIVWHNVMGTYTYPHEHELDYEYYLEQASACRMNCNLKIVDDGVMVVHERGVKSKKVMWLQLDLRTSIEAFIGEELDYKWKSNIPKRPDLLCVKISIISGETLWMSGNTLEFHMEVTMNNHNNI